MRMSKKKKQVEKTPEEISVEEYMKKEEEELDAFLQKNSKGYILSTSPVQEEEDEEEEIFTLDFDNGIATKVEEEKMFIKEEDNILEVTADRMTSGTMGLDAKGLIRTPFPKKVITEALSESARRITQDTNKNTVAQFNKLNAGTIGSTNCHAATMINQPVKVETFNVPTKQLQMNCFVTDLFIRKAISALIKETNKSIEEFSDTMEKAPTQVRKQMADCEKKLVEDKRQLTLCIRGNIVDYDRIPDFAMTYVKEYIEDCITNIAILSER